MKYMKATVQTGDYTQTIYKKIQNVQEKFETFIAFYDDCDDLVAIAPKIRIVVIETYDEEEVSDDQTRIN